MKIVVFGLGRIYQKRKKVLMGHQVVGYIDNNSELWGTKINGITVHRPDDIVSLSYDVVCIMTKYKEEIKEQLIKLGVQEQVIVGYNEISGRNLILYNKLTDVFNNKKSILFFTHDMSASGAPIVLYYFACIIKKYGFAPAVICRTEGPIQQEFLDEGIPVIINSDLTRFNWLLWKIIESFDYYVLNTIIYADLVKDIGETGKKTVWWLHDSEFYYMNRAASFFPNYIPDNVSIYAVGERAKATFQKYINYSQVKKLLYGIPDRRVPKINGKKKLVFAIIGAICPRKAQDIFIRAIERLKKVERCKADFWIIGIIENKEFFECLKVQMENIEEIRYVGDLKREEILKIYQEIDVVCCPSRDDPMPVVMAETFMNGKVAIVSENTGIAPLIKNREDGFIVQSENFEQLSDIMSEIIDGEVDIERIGKKSRQIYESNFSFEAFEREIVRIIECFESK